MDNSNEKLKLAEDLYNKVKFMSSPEAREMTLTLEQIFPELRESEDEKIRKAIQIYLDWLDGRKDYAPKGEYSIRDMISWLNKKKPVKLNEEDEKTRKDLIEFVNQYGDKFYGTIAKASAISWLEKQGKQKPSDKVEPKFRNGQWIVWQNKFYKVNYDGCGYELIDQNGLSTSLGYEIIDENAHLWDITKDAKDGDVLWCGNPFIFRGFVDKRHPNNPTAYCGINSIDTFNLSEANSWWTASTVYPATKEQRDLLFQKMKETGYEWDAEKKKLKKIEQNTVEWCEDDEKISKAIYESIDFLCLEHFGFSEDTLHNWLESIKDRVQPQSKQEWNEKDKANLGNIIWLCENCEKGIENTWIPSQAREIKELIKSLKPNRWKPSKEQIEAMEYAAAYVDSKEDKEVYRTIKSLLDELKILRDYE